jgi:hypothetical protein
LKQIFSSKYFEKYLGVLIFGFPVRKPNLGSAVFFKDRDPWEIEQRSGQKNQKIENRKINEIWFSIASTGQIPNAPACRIVDAVQMRRFTPDLEET